MTDLRKAAEMALETWGWDISEPRRKMFRERMEVLRQALAQPESYKWEPAIVHNYNPDGTLQSIKVKLTPQSDWLDYEPLKREWVGLTDDEVWELVDQSLSKKWGFLDEQAFAKAIEAKLKEKNT
jgi:hypothetical protein